MLQELSSKGTDSTESCETVFKVRTYFLLALGLPDTGEYFLGKLEALGQPLAP